MARMLIRVVGKRGENGADSGAAQGVYYGHSPVELAGLDAPGQIQRY
jgi:hypothetical protein